MDDLLRTPFRPEAKLLLAAARRFLGPPGVPSIRDQLPAELDAPLAELDQAVALAEVHSVLPLLHRAMEQDCPERMPDALRQKFQQIARRNLVMTRVLLQLLDRFEATGVAAIPVKGPALAACAYGDVALRSFGDLDFLVRWDDVPRAVKVLLDQGFRLESALHWPGRFRNRDGELSFLRLEGTLRIDLHWELLPRYYARVADVNQPWREPGRVALAGRDVPSLRDEDLLLFLCAHGSKHLWQKLCWVCDVAALMENRKGIDWDRVLVQAERFRCRPMLKLGMLLARDLVGSALPPSIAQAVRSSKLSRTHVEVVRHRIFAGGSEPESAGEFLRFNLPLMETRRDRLYCFAGIFLAPTEAEFRWVQLPPWLYFVYYPLRFVRLGLKYVRRLAGGQ